MYVPGFRKIFFLDNRMYFINSCICCIVKVFVLFYRISHSSPFERISRKMTIVDLRDNDIRRCNLVEYDGTQKQKTYNGLVSLFRGITRPFVWGRGVGGEGFYYRPVATMRETERRTGWQLSLRVQTHQCALKGGRYAFTEAQCSTTRNRNIFAAITMPPAKLPAGDRTVQERQRKGDGVCGAVINARNKIYDFSCAARRLHSRYIPVHRKKN